jgi:2-polyprenyl-6-methoxyphenol hydroxylase-like FAD-dependent oxidoreductase
VRQKKKLSKKAILVSGAGIAGATLAYLLVQSGFAPTLLEHAPTLRTEVTSLLGGETATPHILVE